MKKIKIKKIISITIIAGFIFFSLIPGVLVLAEEPTPTPTPSESPTPAPTPDTVIQTGDADSNLNINNNTNTNVISIAPQPQEELASDSNLIIPNFEFSPLSTISGEIENLISDNLNQAGLYNTATSSSGTGQNEAVSNDAGGGAAIVVSGNANAQANVINIANSNIIDSNGFFLLFNIFAEYFGDLDFRSWGNFNPGSCPSGCQLIEDLVVNNVNTATVSNDIFVNASTGQNIASSSANDATILSGNANAGANVVNVINTNIVGSNYLLIGINNFGDWIGDLVMPDKTFFEKLLGLGSSQDSDDVSIANQNETTLENNANSEAQSGDNLGEGGNTTISTGQSQANTNVANFVNQNIYDSNNLFILIKVHGQWTGNIYGLPQGASWHEENGQIVVQGSGEADAEEQSAGASSNGGYDSVSISNTNNAIIKNNVNVFALTGGNKVVSLNGNANVLTGNANAGANIINLVNTNIIGRNWVFALINIFGNWTGNLSFGQPDLFVGGKVKVNSQDNDFEHHDPQLGDSLNYEFTIINRGDAPATGVSFKSQHSKTQVINDPGTGSQNEDQLEWYFGTLAPGESRTLNYEAGVNYGNPPGYSTLTTIAYAAGNEPDANLQDNTEIIGFRAYRQESSNGPVPTTTQGQPKITLSKTNNATGPIQPNEQIKFTIKLKNEGEASAYDIVIKDKLYNSQNESVNEETWVLGEVFAGEEIVMDYTIELNEDAVAGKYENKVFAEGYDSGNSPLEISSATSVFNLVVLTQNTDLDTGGSETTTTTLTNGNGHTFEETVESVLNPLGQKVEAAGIEETDQQINNDTLNPGNNLFGSLLLSMFGFLNDVPPAILALSALLILALILLAIKRRTKKDEGGQDSSKENPSDEEPI